MSTLRRYVSLWGPILSLFVLNFYLSSLSRSTLWTVGVDDNGKVLHVVGFAVIGIFALRICHGGFRNLSLGPTLLAVLGCILWAASDEVHQLTTGRGSSVGDVVLDTVGVSLSVVLWLATQYGLGKVRIRSGAEADE